MNIGNRIKIQREKLGLSQEELAKRVGYKSRSSINKIENGTNDISQSKVKDFAIALNTTIEYLMGWDKPDFSAIKNLQPLKKVRYIPVLGKIACGTPILAEQNIMERIVLPDTVNADFALMCQGDSMINAKINDGDTVYIHQQPIVENGEIAAVLIDNEATLKKVYLSSNTLKLVPANDNYEPLVYVADEINQVRVLGKAVAVLKHIK